MCHFQNGYFYSYVLYAMNKRYSEKLRDIPGNKIFFMVSYLINLLVTVRNIFNNTYTTHPGTSK